MHPAIGVIGAFLLAIGGYLLFEGIYEISFGNDQGFIGFMSFLCIGAGLWVIALCARPDKPS